MHKTWINKEIMYDGAQLRSNWVYEQTGISGDIISAFVGPADVPVTNMVDLEDVRNNAPIFSRSMLHFIVEHFDGDLRLAVARQRLLVAIAADEIRPHAPDLSRRGDDLYIGDRKLSVSIATSSPISTLIHFALNIESEGAPVEAVDLGDIGINPRTVANAILSHYVGEIESMEHARLKVRPVP